MALNAYLVIEAEKTGAVAGSVTQKGREKSIMVIAANHEIRSPRDQASGLPTGKRQHGPLVITKEVDKASPLLYNILVNNENVKKWKLQFWRPSPAGTEQMVYAIELENANIAGIKMIMPNNKHPELMKFAEYEEVQFTYQKITWTWTDGGITAMDDWESPVT
jgi:type VI secretion system secreted protein Hcp